MKADGKFLRNHWTSRKQQSGHDNLKNNQRLVSTSPGVMLQLINKMAA